MPLTIDCVPTSTNLLIYVEKDLPTISPHCRILQSNMLLSLFDNLFEEKKPAVEAPKKLDNFELEVNGITVPVKIQEERRFNNRITVNSNGVLIRLASNQSIDEKKKNID